MSDDGSEIDEPQYSATFPQSADGQLAALTDKYLSRDGQASVKYPNGDTFTGTYVNGKRHGTDCTYTYAQAGASYKGDYVDGRKHGHGVFRQPDGSVYDGQYDADQRHGAGKYTYANGDVYDGQWVRGVKHGRGTYTYAASKATLSGQWSHGEIVKGEQTDGANRTYKGQFAHNKPAGQDGTFHVAHHSSSSAGKAYKSVLRGSFEQPVQHEEEDEPADEQAAAAAKTSKWKSYDAHAFHTVHAQPGPHDDDATETETKHTSEVTQTVVPLTQMQRTLQRAVLKIDTVPMSDAARAADDERKSKAAAAKAEAKAKRLADAAANDEEPPVDDDDEEDNAEKSLVEQLPGFKSIEYIKPVVAKSPPASVASPPAKKKKSKKKKSSEDDEDDNDDEDEEAAAAAAAAQQAADDEQAAVDATPTTVPYHLYATRQPSAALLRPLLEQVSSCALLVPQKPEVETKLTHYKKVHVLVLRSQPFVYIGNESYAAYERREQNRPVLVPQSSSELVCDTVDSLYAQLLIDQLTRANRALTYSQQQTCNYAATNSVHTSKVDNPKTDVRTFAAVLASLRDELDESNVRFELRRIAITPVLSVATVDELIALIASTNVRRVSDDESSASALLLVDQYAESTSAMFVSALAVAVKRATDKSLADAHPLSTNAAAASSSSPFASYAPVVEFVKQLPNGAAVQSQVDELLHFTNSSNASLSSQLASFESLFKSASSSTTQGQQQRQFALDSARSLIQHYCILLMTVAYLNDQLAARASRESARLAGIAAKKAAKQAKIDAAKAKKAAAKVAKKSAKSTEDDDDDEDESEAEESEIEESEVEESEIDEEEADESIDKVVNNIDDDDDEQNDQVDADGQAVVAAKKLKSPFSPSFAEWSRASEQSSLQETSRSIIQGPISKWTF